MRYISIALFIALILGCAHSNAPVAPDGGNTEGVTGSREAVQDSGRILWGLLDVTIDPETQSVEVVPLRGACFKANVTQFLQPPSGLASWVSFGNLDFSDFNSQGIVRLQVRLTHPFPGLYQYLGFDVLGIFMSDATYSSGIEPVTLLPMSDGSDARLLNADGYTRWFNPTEFPAHNIFGFVPGIYGTPGYTPSGTVNGYRYFCDGLGEGQDLDEFFSMPGNLANRGSFSPGTVNRRNYVVQFPNPTAPLRYQYAIAASWDEPATQQMPTLDDFSLVANQQEAFLVHVDTSASTLYYVDADDNGGTLMMDIEIFDWQALPGEGGGIRVPDGVGAIWVESFSSLMAAPADALSTATISPGGLASSVFSVEIISANPTQAREEPLIVKVESAPTETYDQGFGSPASGANLGAFVLSSVLVSDESPYNQAPSVGDITGETEPIEINIEEYTISALDPEGDPLEYQWSLVDDGEAAVWGNIGADIETIIINWNDYGPGDYDLHCRVRDDFNPWQLAANNPLDITVSELSITCGTGSYGYFGEHWSDHDGVELCFLSDGSVIIQYTLAALNWNWFNSMLIMYENDIGGYCSYTPVPDVCEDDWCRDWSHLYDVDNDGTNVVTHMDCDPADTWGEGEESDDVVAFVLANQPTIVRFIGSIDNSSQMPASVIASKAIPTGSVIAIDFDEDGDLWVLDNSGATYELTKSSTYSVGTAEFTVDMATVAPGTTVVFDWALSYLTGDLYIFTDETTGGTIHRISGSTGAVLDTQTNALDAGVSNPSYGLGDKRGDIEIDHRIFDGENPLAEHCRLVVCGGVGGTGQAGMFARYDQALNLLSTWDMNGLGGGSCNNPGSEYGARYLVFDPIDHEEDPPDSKDAWDHTIWVGGQGVVPAYTVWGSDCRPAPDDWDGW